MKYPEHINNFWRVREIDSSLTNVDYALYGWLCNKLNTTFWTIDRLTQRRDIICGHLGINPRQLEESRNRLKQKGFIDFISKTQTNQAGKKQGVKGSATTYIILNTDGFSVPNRVPMDTPSGREQEHETGTKRALNGTHDKIEIEKKKKTSSAEKAERAKLIFQKFVDMYFVFHKSQVGIDPDFNSADGKAIKKLIDYLAKVSKTKDHEGAVSGFQYIIDNWHKNDDYVFEQLKPAQILYNISRIFIASKKQVA